MKKLKIKSILDSIRKPISKTGGPMSTKKGKKGYNRDKLKKLDREKIKKEDFENV